MATCELYALISYNDDVFSRIVRTYESEHRANADKELLATEVAGMKYLVVPVDHIET